MSALHSAGRTVFLEPRNDAKKIALPNTTEGRPQTKVVYLADARAANWGLSKTQQLQAAAAEIKRDAAKRELQSS